MLTHQNLVELWNKHSVSNAMMCESEFYAAVNAVLFPAAEPTPVRAAPEEESVNMKIWTCKIGEVPKWMLPKGSDMPMREAIGAAYKKITGTDPDFIFSGWGGELDEGERAVVEDRPPNCPKCDKPHYNMEDSEHCRNTPNPPVAPVREPDSAATRELDFSVIIADLTSYAYDDGRTYFSLTRGEALRIARACAEITAKPTMQPQEPKVIALTELSKIRGKFVSYEDYMELLARAEKAEAALADNKESWTFENEEEVVDLREKVQELTAKNESMWQEMLSFQHNTATGEWIGSGWTPVQMARVIEESHKIKAELFEAIVRAEKSEALNAAKDIEIKANIQSMGVMEERISKLEAALRCARDTYRERGWDPIAMEFSLEPADELLS